MMDAYRCKEVFWLSSPFMGPFRSLIVVTDVGSKTWHDGVAEVNNTYRSKKLRQTKTVTDDDSPITYVHYRYIEKLYRCDNLLSGFINRRYVTEFTFLHSHQSISSRLLCWEPINDSWVIKAIDSAAFAVEWWLPFLHSSGILFP